MGKKTQNYLLTTEQQQTKNMTFLDNVRIPKPHKNTKKKLGILIWTK